MTVRPIIFSGPMVRALLDGRKTQTRRIIQGQPSEPLKPGDHYIGLPGMMMAGDVVWPLGPGHTIVSSKPGPHPQWVEARVKYAVGDRLWVRESFASVDEPMWKPESIIYKADGNEGWKHGWRPSIHMPRWASRLTLVVTDVRVIRLNEISWDDAMAEGVERIPIGLGLDDPRNAFLNLWESIHGKGAWKRNPWIVALTFTVHKGNVDSMAEAA